MVKRVPTIAGSMCGRTSKKTAHRNEKRFNGDIGTLIEPLVNKKLNGNDIPVIHSEEQPDDELPVKNKVPNYLPNGFHKL